MKNIPEIRFKDFNNTWEVKRLADVSSRITRRNKNLETRLPLTISAEYGLIDQLEFYKNRVASKDLSNYYLVYNGDFAYNKSYSKDAPFGAIKRLDRYESGALSSLYITFEPNDINSNYLKYFFDSSYWHNEIYKVSQEGARNHGLLNIATEDFFSMSLKISCNIEEQSRIGNLFKNIDDLIENQESMVNSLKSYKKSMLQKMFPSGGKNVPEIRFSGFSGDWEEKKLNELINTIGSKKYIANPEIIGNHPVIQQGDNPISGYSNECPYNNFNKVVLFGDHTLSLYSPDKPFLLATDGIKIIESNFMNRDFLFYLIQNNLPESEGYKRHFTILKNLDVFYTDNLDEQEKIGNFFKNLDLKISNEENLLDSYKSLKKSLLQKMFI